MSTRYLQQDVSATLDYTEDWSDFLALVPGDVITAHEWTASDPAIILSGKTLVGAVSSILLSGGEVGEAYRISNQITTQSGRSSSRHFFLRVIEDAPADLGVLSTALFNRFTSVDEFRAQSLALLGTSISLDAVDDDLLWQSLVSAEAQASHDLRVLFQPTTIIPSTAPQSEVDALVAAGTPFRTEAPYDYDPTNWTMDVWGHLVLRQRPVVRIDSVKFTYPHPGSDVITIPDQWLRIDKKYGHVQFVPTGAMMGMGPLSTYLLQAMSAGRLIPQMIHVRYVAGLEDAARNYPQLVSLVSRMATLKILKSAFLPQSGSISADGLSQSNSVDTSKWQDEIDHDLEAMRQLFHGVRMTVV